MGSVTLTQTSPLRLRRKWFPRSVDAQEWPSENVRFTWFAGSPQRLTMARSSDPREPQKALNSDPCSVLSLASGCTSMVLHLGRAGWGVPYQSAWALDFSVYAWRIEAFMGRWKALWDRSDNSVTTSYVFEFFSMYRNPGVDDCDWALEPTKTWFLAQQFYAILSLNAFDSFQYWVP